MSGTRIFVILGTDHHPFERLRVWADRWQTLNSQDQVIVQYGFTLPPESAQGIEMLTPDDLSGLLADVDVAVTHGGPGTISTVRAAGLMPIIVPRDPALGEHVDDHQIRFSTWAGRRGLGLVVRDLLDLDELVRSRSVAERLEVDHRPGSAAAQQVARIFSGVRDGSSSRAVVPCFGIRRGRA